LYQNSGVSVIEFGVPSENPWLDGPTIRKMHHSMLESGIDFWKSLEIFRASKATVSIPAFVMTYSDAVLKVGETVFLSECRKAGFTGVIIPDMEIKPFEGLMTVRFLDVYQEQRLPKGSRNYDIFYLRISQRPTGQSAQVDESQLKKAIMNLRRKTDSLIIGGFGIKTTGEVEEMMSLGFDGLSISTEILRTIDENQLDVASMKTKVFAATINEAYGRKAT
jgi:tryptophan synthase alpha chain